MISSPCKWIFSTGVEKSMSKCLPYYHVTHCDILEPIFTVWEYVSVVLIPYQIPVRFKYSVALKYYTA